MIFTSSEYFDLHNLFNTPGYAGYKPDVREAPNSDGKVDEDKRYLHVSLKYNPPQWALSYLARAHFHACRVAEALDVRDAFYPRVENGTLRVLEYPVGAGTVEHTDFDLFTIVLWRSTPADLERGPTNAAEVPSAHARLAAEELSPGLHIGRLGELAGLGPATPHSVPGRPYVQRSIIYFAMPAMAAMLPTGETVREWLARVYAESRVYK
jgi:hypothetical protein